VKRQYAVDAAVAVAMIACAFVAVHSFRLGVRIDNTWLFPTTVGIPAVLALGYALSFFAGPATRLNLVLLTGSVTASLYGLEAVLQFVLPERPASREEIAQKAGQPWDTRDKADVALSLRAAGNADAGIVLGATTLRESRRRSGVGANVDGQKVVPLANIADRTIVNCNESGTYAIFDSDEHGFNNPRGTWSEPLDVVIVGDSFVVGSCVPPDENAVARVREHGVRVAGAAVGGFGPLSELGILKEYVAPARPRDVFWFYYEWNDMHDLRGELRVAELNRYLEPGYSQGLLEKQASIDAQLGDFIDHQFAEHEARPPAAEAPADERRSARTIVNEWARLYRLRYTVGVAAIHDRVEECCAVDAFRRILTEADRTVESWGGHLHFVYLPGAVRYYSPASAVINDSLRQRKRILGIARNLGLPIIDLDSVFHEQDDAKAMYHDFRSHFSAEGYRVTGEEIVRYLKQLGYTVH
jgi:hypothetical protein